MKPILWIGLALGAGILVWRWIEWRQGGWMA